MSFSRCSRPCSHLLRDVDLGHCDRRSNRAGRPDRHLYGHGPALQEEEGGLECGGGWGGGRTTEGRTKIREQRWVRSYTLPLPVEGHAAPQSTGKALPAFTFHQPLHQPSSHTWFWNMRSVISPNLPLARSLVFTLSPPPSFCHLTLPRFPPLVPILSTAYSQISSLLTHPRGNRNTKVPFQLLC